MQVPFALVQEDPGQIGQDGYMAISDGVSHLIFCYLLSDTPAM